MFGHTLLSSSSHSTTHTSIPTRQQNEGSVFGFGLFCFTFIPFQLPITVSVRSESPTFQNPVSLKREFFSLWFQNDVSFTSVKLNGQPNICWMFPLLPLTLFAPILGWFLTTHGRLQVPARHPQTHGTLFNEHMLPHVKLLQLSWQCRFDWHPAWDFTVASVKLL